MKSTQTAAATGHPGKMKRKVYEEELHKLQVPAASMPVQIVLPVLTMDQRLLSN